MIPFQAFQFAMMGSAVTEMQHAERERYTQDLEGQYGELREQYGELHAYAENLYKEHEELKEAYYHLSNEHQRLGLASARMIGDFDIVEQERDAFFEENLQLRRIHGENKKKLETYVVMKEALTALFGNADLFLTESITAEQRKKMTRFLDQLPD
jgi:hypothetical protein